MAFSSRLKEELCKITMAQTGMSQSDEAKISDCCAVAFLRAVLIFAGKWHENEYVIRSENILLLDLCEYLLKKYYKIKAVIHSSIITSSYKLALKKSKQVDNLIESILIRKDGKAYLKDYLCDNCFEHFLRGVFLACGTMLNPERGYHLELISSDEMKLDSLNIQLESVHIKMKKTSRKLSSLLYMKGSEQIEDFLIFIGGQRFALKLMEIKVERDYRNMETRRSNSEVANLDRTYTYAASVIGAIQKLKVQGRFESLPSQLRETAELRENYPEASLIELCRLSNGKITKSGLNHRLKKIIAYSQKTDTE